MLEPKSSSTYDLDHTYFRFIPLTLEFEKLQKERLMKENVIYIPSFEGEYKTGLIFSMIEGLKIGKDLKFICDQSPKELERLLNESDLKNVTWTSQTVDNGQWELKIHKDDPLNSPSIGCCGMCGGHQKEKIGV